MKEKVVLAYSGGLDTTAIIPWLKETYDYESTYKLYLVPVDQGNDTKPTEPDDNQTVVKNDKVKANKDSHQVITVPNATGNDFANLIGGNVTVKNSSGQVMNLNDKLATGCTINDTYSVAVLGDVNGDGDIDTGDTFLLKLVVLGQRKLDNKCFFSAGDVNQDGEIDTGDTFLLKKQILNISNITL